MLIAVIPKAKSCLVVMGVVSSIVFLIFPASIIALEAPAPAINPDEDIEAELKYLQEETYVITGSRIPQQIEKTAHSVFVVTDKEIQQMGARFLVDVIPIVPGWHLFTNYGKLDMILVRGAGKSWGSDVLVMINNMSFRDAGAAYRLLSLDNAKRIEFVSGPASASYGSNATSGVINIITKEADDVDGLEVSVRSGSYNTRQTNILVGKTIKDFEITGNFNYFETDGYDEEIDEDEQTFWDSQIVTNASSAPGKIKGDADRYDVQMALAYKDFKIEGKYYNHEYEFPLGMRNILDDKSEIEWDNYYLNFVYDTTLWEGFDLLTTLTRKHSEWDQLSQIFPEGSAIGTPTGGVILSEPLYQGWTGKIDVTIVESQATFELTGNNTFVAGVVYREGKITGVNYDGNYIPTDNPSIVIPISSFQDWPDEFNWDDPYDRTSMAFFLEDVWDVRKNLRINLGVRYDKDNDFGHEYSPFAGLNWQFVDNYYVKMNYGHAFRAPSYMELYQPVTGNNDLDPETEDTYELGIGARFLPAFTGQVTCFYREIKDSIIITFDDRNYNAGKSISRGVEIQIKYDFGRGSYLSMNYTHVDEDDQAYVQPERMGSIMANARLNQYLNWNAHCLYRGDWQRQKDDPRDDMKDYVIVNTKLTARKFLKGFDGLEFGFSVFNLFDEEYSEPSDQNGGLPDDFPMPGRNYMFELRYHY